MLLAHGCSSWLTAQDRAILQLICNLCDKTDNILPLKLANLSFLIPGSNNKDASLNLSKEQQIDQTSANEIVAIIVSFQL